MLSNRIFLPFGQEASLALKSSVNSVSYTFVNFFSIVILAKIVYKSGDILKEFYKLSLLFFQNPEKFLLRHRFRIIIALYLIAADSLQQFHLFSRLHALRNNAKFKLIRH